MIYCASVLLEQALFWEVTRQTGVRYGALAVTAMALRFICDRRASYASYRASVDVKRILRDRIYSKLLRLGAAYREKVSTSEVVQMAAEEWSSWKLILENICLSCFTVCWAAGNSVCVAVFYKLEGPVLCC